MTAPPTRERVAENIYRYNATGRYQVIWRFENRQCTEMLPPGAKLRDAQRRRDDIHKEIHDGNHVQPDAQTVAAALAAFLTHLRRRKRAANTIRSYGYCYALIGELGKKPVQKVTTADGNAWCDQLIDAGKSGKYVKDCIGAVQVAFEWLRKSKVLSLNVWHDVDRPEFEKPDIHPLTLAETAALLDVLSAADTVYARMLALGIYVPVRIESELGGLPWRNVNLRKRTIALTQAMLRDGKLVKAGRYKTKARSVAISAEACAILEAQRRWQSSWGFPDIDGERLVFTDEHGDRIPPTTLRYRFKTYLKAAGLGDRRVHDLRHTGATIMLELGQHPKVVQELLGHSTIAMTMNTYSHISPNISAAAADQLASALTRQRAGRKEMQAT